MNKADKLPMSSERIREIQKETAYPESRSVQQTLFQVWNECQQYHNEQLSYHINVLAERKYSEEEVRKMLDDVSNYVSAKEMRDDYEVNFSEWKRKKEWFVDYLFNILKKK